MREGVPAFSVSRVPAPVVNEAISYFYALRGSPEFALRKTAPGTLCFAWKRKGLLPTPPGLSIYTASFSQVNEYLLGQALLAAAGAIPGGTLARWPSARSVADEFCMLGVLTQVVPPPQGLENENTDPEGGVGLVALAGRCATQNLWGGSPANSGDSLWLVVRLREARDEETGLAFTTWQFVPAVGDPGEGLLQEELATLHNGRLIRAELVRVGTLGNNTVVPADMNPSVKANGQVWASATGDMSIEVFLRTP